MCICLVLQVISTQWGDFSTPHLPITIFDTCLDAESSNPGFRVRQDNPCIPRSFNRNWYFCSCSNLVLPQRFEKLISGMYLGEIVRRVLLKMAKDTALFGDRVLPSKLMTPYQLRWKTKPNVNALFCLLAASHSSRWKFRRYSNCAMAKKKIWTWIWKLMHQFSHGKQNGILDHLHFMY